MEGLVSHHPKLLRRELAGRGEDLAVPDQHSRFVGLLFSDVSGFTRLTEQLQQQGPEGAEEVARIVNDSFSSPIGTIRGLGGSVISFGGDALFAVFPGSGGVRHAREAAEQIQEQFRAMEAVQTSAGAVEVNVSQVVHAGDVQMRHVGTDRRRQFLLSGDPVQELARLESEVKQGALLVSDQANEALERGGEVKEDKEPSGNPPETLLARYMPMELTSLIGSFEGAFREATVVFLETPSMGLEATQSFFEKLEHALELYGGMLLKWDISSSGTKWLCLFGVPKAHDRDPVRAASMAVHLREESEAMETKVRAGLHTGTVANLFIGTAERRSFDVMGDAVNTAARVLGRAEWGDVLATATITERHRELESTFLEEQSVKGREEPVSIHKLEGRDRSREKTRVMSPLVGRDEEMDRLEEELEAACAGRWEFIGVRGQAGLGKSRLKYELTRKARTRDVDVYEGHAPSFGGSPYQMIGNLLREILSLSDDASGDRIRASITETGEERGLEPRVRHHLADVLGTSYPEATLDQIDPETRRELNLSAIREMLEALAKEAPHLFVLEDMQWADEMSRQFVERVMDEEMEGSGLLLLLYRPGYEAPEELPEIELDELPDSAVADMMDALLTNVSGETKERLVDRSGGNPFFAEELVLHLRDRGYLEEVEDGYEPAAELDLDELPDTIRSLLTRRFDALPPVVKKVVQRASVIGRNFSKDLLLQFEDVQAYVDFSLDELIRREIILERPEESAAADGAYLFKHELSRDVAYETILVSNREDMHKTVADAIESLYEDQIEDRYADLGHHREHAGQIEAAKEVYSSGAEIAREAYAVEEASELYRKSLDLVGAPDQESVSIRIDYGGHILMNAGKPSKALGILRKALREAKIIDDRESILNIQDDLAVCHWQEGRFDEAISSWQNVLSLSRKLDDLNMEESAISGLALINLERGNFERAENLTKKSIELARELGDERSEAVNTENLAVIYHLQEEYRRALELYREARSIYCGEGMKNKEAKCIYNIAGVYMDRGDFEEARPRYEEALALIEEVGNRRLLGLALGKYARLLRRSAAADRNPGTVAKRARSLFEETGERLRLGLLLCEMGHQSLVAGEPAEARSFKTRAEEIAGDLEVEPESKLGQSIESLDRAIHTFEEGGELIRGECPDDFPGREEPGSA